MSHLNQWPVEVKQDGNTWTVLFGGREEARCRNKDDATEIGRDIASRTNSRLSFPDDEGVARRHQVAHPI